MRMAEAGASLSREEAIAAYKRLLQTYIDRRPSGTRQKIALALGKHKSFVSQITNPSYPAPVPERHLQTIFELCHFSPEERKAFLAAYRAAHPERRAPEPEEAAADEARVIRIVIPPLGDPRYQREVAEAISQVAKRIIALALDRSG